MYFTIIVISAIGIGGRLNGIRVSAANLIPKLTTDNSCQEDFKISTQNEQIIHDFLSSNSYDGEKFYIQGWRWHTLSLVRDSFRLSNYAQDILQDTTQAKLQALCTAAMHVINFNLKGLQRIEDDTFFPWMRQKISNSNLSRNTRDALEQFIDEVDVDRKKVNDLAIAMASCIESLVDPLSDKEEIYAATRQISQSSKAISYITKSIKDREDGLIVPTLAKIVPPGEQKSFNNKVLRSLGIFESRCHLAAMHDAVHDTLYGNDEEMELFREHIPSVAKMMISRWKRNLYDPKVGVLDEFKG